MCTHCHMHACQHTHTPSIPHSLPLGTGWGWRFTLVSVARRASPSVNNQSAQAGHHLHPPTIWARPAPLSSCLSLTSFLGSITPSTLTSVFCAPLICLGTEGWEVGVGGGSVQTDPGLASCRPPPPLTTPLSHPRKSPLGGDPYQTATPESKVSYVSTHAQPTSS